MSLRHGRLRFAISLMLLSFLFVYGTGCHRAGTRMTEGTPETLNSIVAELRARSRLTQTMQLQMSIEAEANGERSEAREILYYKQPDKFRLHVLDPLNSVRVVILAAGNEFTLFYVREMEGVRGPLSDDALKKNFQMDLRVSDVKSALMANPFAEGTTENAHIRVKGTEVWVTRPADRLGHRDEIRIGRQNDQPVVLEWWVRPSDDDDKFVQRAAFSDYREFGGILRPTEVVIERPADKTTLKFRTVDAEMNLPLDDARFEFNPPPDAKMKQVSQW